ncbi:MAG: spore coat protein [Planctomycetota bacterium]|nr:MAG: spore coat protein [Planctomycetota bacterium]
MISKSLAKKETKKTFSIDRKYGKEEIKEVIEAIESDDLFYANGLKTKQFCEVVKKYFNANYVATASSGTAAIHAAIASLEIEPGYEVIVPPITDIGSIIGLLYQNLIPIFADVDPHTYNMTAETIEKQITYRTRAIIVVHLAGNPCQMDEILELSKKNNIPIVEDVAQSYNATYRGHKAGTLGTYGCFSMNAYKHISCGDGGFLISHNENDYIRSHNYLDKFYDRHQTGVRLEALAPCYRISELQSAVGIAQMGKLTGITEKRNYLGDLLTSQIESIDCLTPHKVEEGNECTYWFYMMRIKPEEITCTRNEFCKALSEEGVPASSGYIPQVIYLEKLFTEKNFFPGNVWPAEIISQKKITYEKGLCPIAEEVLETAINFPIKESFTKEDIELISSAVYKVAKRFQK